MAVHWLSWPPEPVVPPVRPFEERIETYKAFKRVLEAADVEGD